MTTPLALTTDGMPAQASGTAWRDWMATLFHGLDTDLHGATTFAGRLRSTSLHELSVTSLEGDPHRVQRLRQRATVAGYLKVVVPWQGVATVEQHGQQARIGPGSWGIYDTTHSYAVDNPERSHHLILMLPKAHFTADDLARPALMGRRVGGEQGVARLALDTMRNACRELPHLSAAARQATSAMIIELVRLSLRELAGQEPTLTATPLRTRIEQHLRDHLRDADLSLDSLAQALGCSKRQLHLAYQDADTTLAHTILQLRLQACMRDLADPAHAGRTITEIAFSWGFNASEHFSRAFRRHVGCAPSVFRQRQPLATTPAA